MTANRTRRKNLELSGMFSGSLSTIRVMYPGRMVSMHQRIQKTPWLLLSVLLFILSAGFPFYALAQDPTATPTIDSATAGLEGFEEAQGMTLFELLKAGSWVMMILIALSALALGLAIYYALTLSEKKLIPSETVTQIRHYLRDRRYEDIARLCRRSKGMFSKIIVAGISRGMIEPTAAASTMEPTITE